MLKARSRGLTLAELMITMVLTTILVVGIATIFRSSLVTVFTQVTRTGAQGEVGQSFMKMSQELRRTTSVASAQARTLSITVDTDGDGLEETIQYSWSGTAGQPLNRVGDSTSVLIHSVANLAFSYYDSNHNPLSFPVTASQVRLAAVDLTVTDGDETFTLRSQARLRNL